MTTPWSKRQKCILAQENFTLFFQEKRAHISTQFQEKPTKKVKTKAGTEKKDKYNPKAKSKAGTRTARGKYTLPKRGFMR